MKIQQIRNATLKVTYAGATFLIDPWLAGRWEMGCFADIPGAPFTVPDPAKRHIPMPICPLPLPVEEILRGVDYYVVTHIHPDHIDMSPDGTVGAPLDKRVPVFAQNAADAEVLRRSGFADVRVLSAEGGAAGAATLHKAPARHGTVVPCGEAMGVVFSAPGEKTLYIAGDTVWYPEVARTIERFRPDVIALNACAAELKECGRLIMNDEDVESVSLAAPNAQIIVTHMDTVAHASITRYEMRGRLARRGVKYVMPEDGETVEL